MREVIPREAAADPEPFTGERLTASIHGQVEVEHYHRYLFARGFCAGKDVLDVASGEGYGAAHLAQVARRVVGIEFAGPTARNAAANFNRSNLHFIRGDARSLPLGRATVDVVTSFETIEHFDRQDVFVAEIRRVLRQEGCFIVSTPDRDIYSPPGRPLNPFHVREFDRSEFIELLQHHFRFVSVVRQRPVLASVLMPEEPSMVAPLIFERGDERTFVSDTALPRAPYLIAIASDTAPIAAPVSLLVERSDIDNVSFADQEMELIRSRKAEEAAREAELIARKAAERFEAEARSAVTTLAHVRAALVQANSELDRVSGSARHFLYQYIPRLWRHLVR